MVEFFRELPGLLIILILAAMYRFTESRVFKIGTAIMLAGLLGLLLGPAGPELRAKFSVVLFMVIFSAGEHIIMPVKSTISMDLAKPSQGGASLGITSGLDQLGRITGYVMVTFFFFFMGRINLSGMLPYRVVFGAAAFLILAAIFVSLAMGETMLKGPRRRFYFHKKFFKFYMLEIFYGARKQVFLTFAPYVLILQYGAGTSVIALLYVVCSGAGFILSPLIGKLIDKVGYKFIMVTDTLILVIVCFFYGFSHRIFPMHIAYLVVCTNFVLDSIISLASMASNVYVKDIASSKEELTATLSTGISVNHLISIAIALFGGWIWERTGIEVLFSLSAFLGILNSIYAGTIKGRPRS
jgi:MFS family permease